MKNNLAPVYPPILDTLELMDMQTGLPIYRISWYELSHPIDRPPEKTGVMDSSTRASAPLLQKTHAPWGLTTDVYVLERCV